MPKPASRPSRRKGAQYVYGPFPHGGQLKEALKIIRKIFPFFDTKKPVTEIRSRHDRGRVRFYQQIGLYPTQDGDEARAQYRRTINHVRLFFAGKKKALMRQLEREMKQYAKKQEFEMASEIKRRLFALQHIQDVSLIKDEARAPDAGRFFRIEAYDVAHLRGSAMVGVVTVVENGEPSKQEYRTFAIRSTQTPDDPKALKEVLTRRLGHPEWRLPNLIVVDGGEQQMRAAEATLAEFGYRFPVIAVVKDERHKPSRILGDASLVARHQHEVLLANSEAHRFAIGFHRRRRSRMRG